VFKFKQKVKGRFVKNIPWPKDDRIPWETPSGLGQPDVSPASEYKSLVYHIQHYFNLNYEQTQDGKFRPKFDPAIRNKVLNHLETVYSTARWKLPDNFLSDEHITSVIQNKINPRSSPGHPKSYEFTINRELIDDVMKLGNGLQPLVDEVKERMQHMLNNDDYRGDPSRLFVKQEPHKVEKINLGRHRLIFNVSIIDQIIDHCLLDPSLDAMYENHTTVPNKVGMSFYNGGTHNLFRYLDDGTPSREIWGSTDKTAYDITTPLDAYEVDEIRRTRMCDNRDHPQFKSWQELFKRRNKATYNGDIILSDGTIYEQIEWYCPTCDKESKQEQCSCGITCINMGGITRSGGVRTIDMNSFHQVYLRYYHQYVMYGELKNDFRIGTMGDDTVENFPKRDNIAYGKWLSIKGFHVKMNDKLTQLKDIEFCSHRFIRHNSIWVPVPLNWNKHAFNLKCNPEGGKYLIETLFSLCIEYTFDEDRFRICRDLIVLHGTDKQKSIFLRSPEWFKELVSGCFESAETIVTRVDRMLSEFYLSQSRPWWIYINPFWGCM